MYQFHYCVPVLLCTCPIVYLSQCVSVPLCSIVPVPLCTRPLCPSLIVYQSVAYQSVCPSPIVYQSVVSCPSPIVYQSGCVPDRCVPTCVSQSYCVPIRCVPVPLFTSPVMSQIPLCTGPEVGQNGTEAQRDRDKAELAGRCLTTKSKQNTQRQLIIQDNTI